MNKRIFEKHLRDLSYAYPIDVLNNYSDIIVQNFRTPPGYNKALIDVWIMIPEQYPQRPPGLLPNRIYLPAGLRYHDRQPADYYPGDGPKGWAWWCFERIEWDPCRDDLITLLEIVRATMTDQSLKKRLTETSAAQGGLSWIKRALFE